MSKNAHELFDRDVLLTFANEAIRYRDPIVDQEIGMFLDTLFIVDAGGNPCTKGYDGFYLENGTLFGFIDGGAPSERVVVDHEAANRTIRNMWKHRKM